jgi:hypothetical protein
VLVPLVPVDPVLVVLAPVEVVPELVVAAVLVPAVVDAPPAPLVVLGLVFVVVLSSEHASLAPTHAKSDVMKAHRCKLENLMVAPRSSARVEPRARFPSIKLGRAKTQSKANRGQTTRLTEFRIASTGRACLDWRLAN